ncbi:MAG: hypothetical protein ISS92_05465 [Candidatus Omnitrophica bacterium]|nr:hypothetical protein [Candidatus Omnitrophota bacterium]
MKKLFFIAALLTAVVFLASGSAFAADKALFSFEGEDTEGWEIPDWAYEQDDYLGEELDVSRDVAKDGKKSLKLTVNFPGNRWNGAVAEIMEYYDWTPYSTLSCDIYVPEDAPVGLRAKMILTVGEDWKWTEMSRSDRLKPGEWTHISANLKPGSTSWRRTKPTDEFRADVRKIAIRVETNKPAYNGPIYIDNVVLGE